MNTGNKPQQYQQHLCLCHQQKPRCECIILQWSQMAFVTLESSHFRVVVGIRLSAGFCFFNVLEGCLYYFFRNQVSVVC